MFLGAQGQPRSSGCGEVQPPALWAQEENITYHSPKSFLEVLGPEVPSVLPTEMTRASLVQVAGCTRAVREQLTQL